MSKYGLICDPPSGWMYGFPRVYDPGQNETEVEWFRRMGYPEHLIKEFLSDDGKSLNYCRWWGAQG